MTDHDIYLFREGTHGRLYDKLGAHLGSQEGKRGAHFAVWAPNAERVSVIGDWNGWNTEADPMAGRGDGSGVWQAFVPGVVRGQAYKYHIASRVGGYRVDKADPYALFAEAPPRTGSRLWSLEYEWGDAAWMSARRASAR